MNEKIRGLKERLLSASVNLDFVLREIKQEAVKNNDESFINWINNELNGYDLIDAVPKYRIIKCELGYDNKYHGWRTFDYINFKDREILEVRQLPDKIAKVQRLLEEYAKGNRVLLDLPYEIKQTIQKFIFPRIPTDIKLLIPQLSLQQIVDGVKGVVMDWILEHENVCDLPNKENENMNSENDKIIIHAQEIKLTQGDNGNIIIGNNNNVKQNLSCKKIYDFIHDIEKTINSEQIEQKDKDKAIGLIHQINTVSLDSESSDKIMKCLSAARDFLFSVGANIAASQILQLIQTFF